MIRCSNLHRQSGTRISSAPPAGVVENSGLLRSALPIQTVVAVIDAVVTSRAHPPPHLSRRRLSPPGPRSTRPETPNAAAPCNRLPLAASRPGITYCCISSPPPSPLTPRPAGRGNGK